MPGHQIRRGADRPRRAWGERQARLALRRAASHGAGGRRGPLLLASGLRRAGRASGACLVRRPDGSNRRCTDRRCGHERVRRLLRSTSPRRRPDRSHPRLRAHRAGARRPSGRCLRACRFERHEDQLHAAHAECGGSCVRSGGGDVSADVCSAEGESGQESCYQDVDIHTAPVVPSSAPVNDEPAANDLGQ